MNINELVKAAVVAGMVENGAGMALAGRNKPLSGLDRSHETWTEAEEDYLREHAGRLPEDVISQRLGRSAVGVKIHRERELHLPSPIKDPEYITGYRLALALGLNEPRKVSAWIRAGILDGEMVPYRDHDVSRVRIATMLEWVVNPESWLYFHPERVAEPNLRRLIHQAVEEWGDEWWNTRQMEEYHQVTTHDACRVIRKGRVQAVHVQNISGRHAAGKWAFWMVRRSECVQWDREKVFRKRKAREK